ncbi:hypothetical protein Tco_1415407, partial [Tanacetum coccineum]
MKRTLEARSTSNSKRISSAGGGSTSSARSCRGDVSDAVADVMTLDLNTHSLIRPLNKSCRGDEGRHTSRESSESVSRFRVSNSSNLVGLEHEADVVVEPHVDSTEVATNTSQTRRGQMLQRLRFPSIPSHNEKRILGLLTIQETYKEKLLIKHGSDKSLHPVGDIDLWLDCSGGWESM